jgi:hypothetical protein
MEKKHPLDIANFFVLCLGFAAAAVAAWYTHDQVQVSRDTEERQLRAYVGLDTASLDLKGGGLVVPNPEAGEAARAQFTNDYFLPTFKNSGLTPARDLRLTGQLVFSSTGLPANLRFSGPDESVNPNFVSRATLSAGQSGSAKAQLTVGNDALIRRSMLNGTNIFFYGSLTYTDVFGRHWKDRFCLMLDASDTTGNAFIPCDRYNDEIQLG